MNTSLAAFSVQVLSSPKLEKHLSMLTVEATAASVCVSLSILKLFYFITDDDFAKNIEKTLATILNKKEKEAAGLASASGEDAEKERDPSEDKREEKRGKKRRKSERDRKHKQRKLHSPKLDVIDENDIVDMRGGSPKLENRLDFAHSGHSEESNESEHAEDQNKVHDRDGKRKKKKNKGRDRDRMKNRGDNQGDQHLKDAQGVCVFYLQGKCQKCDCPYSHEAVPPMKLELCKFYLMDCCAKGDKCSYMHSEFPCKFYHTGLKCAQEDDCKFAHGRPLSESLKQILFKHIETAPREILGGFPRMNREEALNMINERQVKLYDQEKGPGAENKPEGKGGIPSLFDINVPIPHELLQGCDVKFIPGCEDASLGDVGEWFSRDEQCEITDEEIVTVVNSEGVEDIEESETVEPKKVSHKEGVKIFEAAIKYVEQQEEARVVDVMMLQRWRDLAATKRDTSARLMKITSLKQILFKHIETAPREILGGFPRMNREEALNMINERQVKLYDQEKGPGAENKPEGKGGIPSLFDINVPIPHELLQGCDDPKKMDKSRNRHSRWQEPENSSIPNDFPLKPFSYGQDQDMRITSNGDIDMRTLPPSLTSLPPPKLSLTNKFPDSHNIDIEKYKREAGILQSSKQDVDIRSSILPLSSSTKDTDIRHQSLLATKDIDIRQMPPAFGKSIATSNVENDQEDEPMLQIDTEDDKKEETSLLPDLPKTQRDLYMRIQAHQKDSVTVTESKKDFELDENINWYSDDDDEDDDNRLTIKVDNEDVKDSKEEAIEPASISNDFLNNSPQIKPQDVVDKLGDLSKIDISAEVTKLLTSMSQNRNQFPFGNKPAVPQVPEVTPNTTPPRTAPEVRDPRVSRQDPRLIQEKSDPARVDPRLSTDPRQRRRQSSTETAPRPDKVTIYEQGTFDKNSSSDDDIDIRVYSIYSRSSLFALYTFRKYTANTETVNMECKEEAIEPASISNDFLNNSPQIKPQDVVDKLGDLSKIDISAEVTKLLTSMSQNRNQFPFGNKPAVPQVPEVTPNTTPPRTAPEVRDPRVSRQVINITSFRETYLIS
uniref:Uncharacterized protein LOC114336436 n=1 Tax=Diabrotica virgifera virgifera TaxID=50390 RepID=A0A6P7G112_DIAVI